jgi:hypothetical protein
VDEGAAVLDLACAADDRGLAERFNGVRAAQRLDEPVSDQPREHGRDPRRLVGEVVGRAGADPGVAHDGGDAGLPGRPGRLCPGLGHHHLAIDDDIAQADASPGADRLHATAQ